MVKFSCFPSHIHHHRSKKPVEHSKNNFGEPQEVSPGCFHLSPSSASSNTKLMETNLSHSPPEQTASPSSFDCCWKSEELSGLSGNEGDRDPVIKRSQSLGNGMDTLSCVVEDESGQGLSFDNPTDENNGMAFDSLSDYVPKELHTNDDPRVKFCDLDQENASLHSFETNSDAAGNESVFKDSFHEGRQQHSPIGLTSLGHFTWKVAPPISKSHSMPRLESFAANSANEVLAHEPIARTRSFNNFSTITVKNQNSKGPEEFHHGVSCRRSLNSSFFQDMQEQSDLLENKMIYQADSVDKHVQYNGDKENNEESEHGCNDQLGDEYDSQHLEIIPGGRKDSERQGDQRWNDLPNDEMNRRKVEDWLSQIDIEDNSLITDEAECSNSDLNMDESHVPSAVTTAKPGPRGSPGMEAAYNYISSLTALSTSAQMANLGLVVVPFLSAFSGLRLLNLSGNSIVRITSGALPRGLHMLNLSKNNISTIEGLRELTRLRVLDLSHNRIMRIGHGLASCLSLKELYLAGNKISEIEGLHRLLKLHILDIRFNKVSTLKCLGQLAANYGSLHTIHLEGNSVQRYVGDEQVKRYLLSILPHLVYYNRHIIRTGSTKDILSHSSRSFSPHQFDRGLRAEQKRSRRGHYGAAAKSPTLSHKGKASPASNSLLRHSRGRYGLASPQHAPLPPTGTKTSHNLSNIGSKLLNLGSNNPIRRSRSEGTF